MKKTVKFDELLLIGMAVISFATAIADFVGILHSVEFLSERIPGMILLFLSAMAVYTIGEKRGKLNDIEMLIESKSNDILKEKSDNYISINNISVFENEVEMYEYVLTRYKQVEKSIDITHFGSGAFYDENDGSVNSRFCKTLAQIVKQGTIQVRRVYLVRDNDQLAVIEKIMNDHKDDSNLSIRCYPGKSLNVYLTSLMIIDDIEVLVTYTEKNIKEFRKTLSIKNPIVVRFYRDYINSLVQESKTIKDKQGVYNTTFNALKNEMHSEVAKYN